MSFPFSNLATPNKINRNAPTIQDLAQVVTKALAGLFGFLKFRPSSRLLGRFSKLTERLQSSDYRHSYYAILSWRHPLRQAPQRLFQGWQQPEIPCPHLRPQRRLG